MSEKPKFGQGETVYFHSGSSPLLKGKVVDHRTVPSGCLFGLISWTDEEYRVQVPGQDWSVWKREADLYRNIHDYERAMHL